ncbi:UNVERIFIED_CONTAM: hypothetical protein RMT77_008420 [Armadillidium vulgare]
MEQDTNYQVFKIVFDISIFLMFFTGLALFIQDFHLKLPPGPLGLPLVGYLPWLDSEAPYKTLNALVDKYGRIYSLKLGSVRTVVISDPEMIRKLLAMEETTGRAPLYLTHGIMKGYGLICSEGDLWKEHRRFVVGFMRNNGMKTGSSSARDHLQTRIDEMASKLVRKLNLCQNDGVDVKSFLLHIIGNTVNGLIFGIHYEEEDPTWVWLRSLLEEGVKLIGIAGPINFLPWLRFLPSYQKTIRFVVENQKKTHEEYKKIWTEKENKLKEFRGKESVEEPDLLLQYIKEKEAKIAEHEEDLFSETQITHVLADMFGAGTETTLSTLQWHLIDLALNPIIQDEVYNEIQLSSKSNGFVKIEDFPHIPLCQAALMETQRLRSVIPLGIPHGVMKDISVSGYHIPKGSMILPFLWRMHHDEKLWSDPMQYNPSRFIDKDGKLKKISAFMPFQTGRRVCIGEDFAKILSITFITKILLNFKISLPEGIQRSDVEDDPVCGISLAPKPFKLIFKLRSNKLTGN